MAERERERERERDREERKGGGPFPCARPNCGRCHDKYRVSLGPVVVRQSRRRASSPTLPMLIAPN
jgi:hypothetical protein